MAKNQACFVRNLQGAPEPLIVLGLFQAGATQAIKRGELIELTGDTNTAWVPLDSDFAMAGNVAIAMEEIKSGDLAGYYPIMVPRPGDVFEFALATADATAVGTALYFSDSETVTVTTGTNIIGHLVGQEHYPQSQRHLSDGAIGDAGTTVRNTSYARMTITKAASYYAALQQ